MNERLKNKLDLLPEHPGCYLMKDSQGAIIYVGKAKVLKRRIRSYFIGVHDGKTERLVNQIADFEFIVTSSDLEALILEKNLIKRYTPKYNMMLKDDKSYPYIKITAERNPQLLITREVKSDNGKYFGPFPHFSAAAETKRLLHQLYPLRKCPLNSNRPCLYYQLGQCIGSCVREVSEEEYDQVINRITRFFHGGYKKVIRELNRRMKEAAHSLNFERAKNLRNQISSIEAVMEPQNLTTIDHINRDVFGFDVEQDWICIQVFHVRQGKMMERNISIFPLYDEPESVFLTYLGQFYAEDRNLRPKEILIPEGVNKELARQFLQTRIVQPKRGHKKELVKMAYRNARASLQERLALMELGVRNNF